MATYYVDPTATGNDDGTTTTDAWTSVQRAVDGTDGTKPVGGDVVYCKCASGVQETLTVSIDITALNGTSSDLVKFIAVNSSWVVDWVDRYTVDANNVVGVALLGGVATDYTSWESFQFTQSTTYGVTFGSSTGATANVFVNCEFDNCNDGIHGYKNAYGVYQQCIAHHNNDAGFYQTTGVHIGCVAYLNGEQGFYTPYGAGALLYGCVAYLNTTDGFGSVVGNSPLVHCVAHDNGAAGVDIYTDNANVLGCRITDNVLGIDASSERVHFFANYLQGNTTLISGILNNDLYLKIEGVNTNELAGSDTGNGYNDGDNADFNLTSSASMRDFEVTLPE